MALNLPVKAEENGLLEAAIQAAQVNIQKHRDTANFARFAEVKEVVFEVLVAFHSLDKKIGTVPKNGTVPIFYNVMTIYRFTVVMVAPTRFELVSSP